MVGSVTIVAFVFALVFALFLAWPAIWKLITVGYLSDTGTGSAAGTKAGTKAGTGGGAGGETTAAKGDVATGWSPLEIGGLVGGIAAFIAFVAIVVVFIRGRGSGEPGKDPLDAIEVDISRGRLRNAARGATAVTKETGSFLGRNAGKVARFVSVSTNAELKKQQELLRTMRKGLDEIANKEGLEYKMFKEHTLKQLEIFKENVRLNKNGKDTGFATIEEYKPLPTAEGIPVK